MEEESYLLNIDVLGFGAFVNSNSTQEVFNYYARIITGSAFAAEIVEKDNIEVMVYSDTIAIKSNNKDKTKCLNDLVKIAQLLQTGQYYSAIDSHTVFLPLRGTISYGEFIFHKGGISTQALGRSRIEAKDVNIILGKPIVESYYFEKDMEIIGVALVNSVTREGNAQIIDALVNSNLLIRYRIPLKNGNSSLGYLINPSTRPHFDLNLKRLNSERNKFQPESSEYKKYSNTIDLFQHIKENDLFYPNIKSFKNEA